LSDDAVMKPTYDENTYETNVKNVFIAGVICGGMNTHRLFIENSREHAQRVIRTVKERSKNCV
jgi:bacillithiol disulfide reductase